MPELFVGRVIQLARTITGALTLSGVLEDTGLAPDAIYCPTPRERRDAPLGIVVASNCAFEAIRTIRSCSRHRRPSIVIVGWLSRMSASAMRDVANTTERRGNP